MGIQGPTSATATTAATASATTSSSYAQGAYSDASHVGPGYTSSSGFVSGSVAGAISDIPPSSSRSGTVDPAVEKTLQWLATAAGQQYLAELPSSAPKAMYIGRWDSVCLYTVCVSTAHATEMGRMLCVLCKLNLRTSYYPVCSFNHHTTGLRLWLCCVVTLMPLGYVVR